jgi:uncharacterized protein involved in exopolysaccharide biosynthesis
MNPPRKTSPSSRGSSQEKEAPALSLDYNHLGRLCLKYWKWLAGGLLIGVIAGYLVAAFQTPIYSARATIEVNAKANAAPGEIGVPDGISDDMMKTFEQILQTKNLAEGVVKEQHLNENPQFLADGPPAPVSEDTATGMLASEITIRIRPLTRLIDITVEHESPQMAQMLANWLAQESIAQEVEQHAGTTTVLSDYLQKEVDRLQQELAVSEHKLQDYQAQHNLGVSIDHPDDAQATRLDDLNKQYSDAQAQVTLLEERYGPEHPKLIAAKTLVDELRDQLGKAQAEAVTSSSQNTDYSSLRSNVESDRSQLANMLKELQEAKAQVHVEIPGISVEEEATMPYAPVRPNKPKSIAVGGFAGLLCGVAFVLGDVFGPAVFRGRVVSWAACLPHPA